MYSSRGIRYSCSLILIFLNIGNNNYYAVLSKNAVSPPPQKKNKNK